MAKPTRKPRTATIKIAQPADPLLAARARQSAGKVRRFFVVDAKEQERRVGHCDARKRVRAEPAGAGLPAFFRHEGPPLEERNDARSFRL